ncbi:hypothetical protein ACVV2G_32955 [Streptomyces ziwulingensis]
MRAKQAKRFQSDYELLNETVVLLDKLAGITGQKANLAKLGELLSLFFNLGLCRGGCSSARCG